jgi:hypothetical protein
VSVKRQEGGGIALEGDCPVEDAELLLQMLQANPAGPVDWTGCRRLHTAVAQVILAARPTLVGPCGDPWFRQWMEPAA